MKTLNELRKAEKKQNNISAVIITCIVIAVFAFYFTLLL